VIDRRRSRSRRQRRWPPRLRVADRDEADDRHHADSLATKAIGSGPTEGSCKSVVAVRCKRSSQRWFETGASVVLQLRTLSLNAIRHHERRQIERLRA
jgi:hypothetical protein